ncbi:hypothetical protein BD410DRAFT_769716 [Rickenella mellea]|uniref:Glycosyltransferase family 24 protein n=1 Tax=Rickenella mellea TaxID=50990 RepID=A0A4Y7Q6K5_9AGAM|nr:hypothetical protein BD410DRAFT_769716 [Rickenella mellea]
MKRLWGLGGALVASINIGVRASSSPQVKVGLRSSWPEVPLILEVLESVAVENSDAFFPLLEALTAQNTPTTQQAIHEFALETAVSLGYLKEPGALASAELHIALHAATPKIQAFYQYYADQHFAEISNCTSWVDWYGERICDLDTLMRLVGHESIESTARNSSESYVCSQPKILTFDHINPPRSRNLQIPPRTAIFYASPTSTNFRDFHTYLLKLSSSPMPRVEYVFRHVPPEGRNVVERSYLSGYGVSLDLKKTDYLALDDRRSKQPGQNEETSDDTVTSNNDYIFSLLEQLYPENKTMDMNAPLTKEELKGKANIGIKATQLLHDSKDELGLLTILSQNFPKYATSIARRVVINESLHNEIQDNQPKAQGGISMAWLNGLAIPETDMTPLGLLRLMRKERSIILSLTSLGLSPSQAVELLTHPLVGEAHSDSGVLDGLVDASDRPEGGSAIVWWNDFTKDSRYVRWDSSLLGLLRGLYPGQFHQIRLNLFNVVLVMDLSQTSSLNFIAGAVKTIISRAFPFRFGIVPSVETLDGQKMARIFYYLIDNLGRAKTMTYLSQLTQLSSPMENLSPGIDWEIARAEFDALIAEHPPQDGDVPTDFDSIVEDGDSQPTFIRLERARAYAIRLDAKLASSPTGHAFVNGKHFDLGDDFLRHMQLEQQAQVQHLIEKVYSSQLTEGDAERMDTYFYDLPETTKKRSPYIFQTTETGDLRIHNLPDLFHRMGVQPTSGQFIYPTESDQHTLTTYVVADLDSEAGIALMREAVDSLENGSPSRLSFVHNPAPVNSPEDSPPHTRISQLVAHLIAKDQLARISHSTFKAILDWRMEDDATNPTSDTPVSQIPLGSDVDYDGSIDAEMYKRFCHTSLLVARELGLSPSDQAVVVNGRIVGPLTAGSFMVDDFKTLEEYELRKRVRPVAEALRNMTITPDDLDRATYSTLISMASSVIAAVQIPDPSEQGLFNTHHRVRHRQYRLLSGTYSAFDFGEASKSAFNFGFLIDPLSESAQKWSGLLMWLATIDSVYAEVHLNPATYREMPLKRFYRYNLRTRLSFNEDGSENKAQTLFNDLPSEPIYTLGLDVPPAWLVRPREADHDLDNIQLSALSSSERLRGVEAIFDLDFIVIEGHARDALTNSPPRGLQLQLTSLDSKPIDDTQVVANLGYLQFKAKPGVFQLEIREGRGRDVYAMESVGNEGWNSANVDQVGIDVTLTSFEGLTLYPRLRRRPGMEKADVLDEFVIGSSEPKGLFDNLASRVASLFNSKKEEAVPVKPQADINIFTVASGLLYERFASIMILSVLRNTNSTVKFWFIENFLSPSFLEFIPHFAEAYGFDYELVTYKWPSWLRAQTEKQRIIWAYKILFLDVLFPMDLKKVIFVDADQIVRADLKELVDLDLKGAPYGYTPMGDDNYEMEGFRFWKTGYWKDFLRGKPYHISALYVVDLVRFRQLAAGDILRGSYHQLSADPNSLANLDQDLPNNLQREVPIFSLDEDWLWCETWCSKDRLHRAKTIDLCQNPLTKEPKLSRARQIPEWEEYDSEIARFAGSLADKGVIRSHIAAVDVNALASAGAAAAAPPTEDSGPSGSQILDEAQPTEQAPEPTIRDEL